MNLLCLTSLCCLVAGPLLAQPQLAVRTDTTAAAPVLVPVSATVRQACQRYLPELAANPAVAWTAAYGYSEFAPAPLLFEVKALGAILYHNDDTTQPDTTHYEIRALFECTGRLLEIGRAASLDTLPPGVRRAVARLLRSRNYRNGRLAAVVVNIDFYARRRHSDHYEIWLHPSAGGYPDWYDLRRSGRFIPHPGRFR